MINKNTIVRIMTGKKNTFRVIGRLHKRSGGGTGMAEGKGPGVEGVGERLGRGLP